MSGNRREFHMRHLEDKPHAVYVIWNEDQPVYVGMTSNWRTRTSAHAGTYLHSGRATHIDVWMLDATRSEAEAIEAATIRELDPPANYQHSPRVEREREAAERMWADYDEWMKIPTPIRDPELWQRMHIAVNSLPDITQAAS